MGNPTGYDDNDYQGPPASEPGDPIAVLRGYVDGFMGCRRAGCDCDGERCYRSLQSALDTLERDRAAHAAELERLRGELARTQPAHAGVEALEEYRHRMGKEPACQRINDESMNAAAFCLSRLIGELKERAQKELAEARARPVPTREAIIDELCQDKRGLEAMADAVLALFGAEPKGQPEPKPCPQKHCALPANHDGDHSDPLAGMPAAWRNELARVDAYARELGRQFDELRQSVTEEYRDADRRIDYGSKRLDKLELDARVTRRVLRLHATNPWHGTNRTEPAEEFDRAVYAIEREEKGGG